MMARNVLRLCLLVLLALSFASSLSAQRKDLLMATEYPPKGEAEATQKIIKLLKERLEKDYPAPERTRRDAHPKQHGLVKAEFTVVEGLPKQYRVGVFAEPATYHAWIRYSNLSGQKSPDIAKDSRGMAIKLMGVEGEKILPAHATASTQDFVFMSTQIFVTKDVKTFGKLLKSINGGKVSAGVFFLTHLGLLKLFSEVRIQVANLFDVEWGSTTPYLLGDRAVKYAVLPRTPSGSELPAGTPSENYLRERMVATLSDQDIYLDFFIQVQTDPVLMPIEDPRVKWNRNLSPFIKVASIKIPRQTFDTPAQQLYGDQLSFSPWHALKVHRPLGGLNRGRRAIYETMSKFRHDRNGEVSEEPEDWITFQ
ncbi:catalase family protein [Lewinella sp. W8]|uniref:catalase family protein n=1 Tax=Lewinella sp. W8 TaxID=2528208 RepID=UPI001067E791|nr:catalase family protein [Lewinella sp. W8]MTB53560.1 catalase [Lewinella sp. W8]